MITKKFLLLIVFILGIENIYAQHISFMGIQLGQSVNVVDRLLRQKGFKLEGDAPRYRINTYTGDFWSFKEATLRTGCENGIVTEILISPKGMVIKKDVFSELIKSLDKKYGNHFIADDPYLDNTSKKYCWKLKGGHIFVTESLSSGKIGAYLGYVDKTSRTPIPVKKGYKRDTNNDL